MLPGEGNRPATVQVAKSMKGPNPLSVGYSVLSSLRKKRPTPRGAAPEPDHGSLAAILNAVQNRGVPVLPDLLGDLTDYMRALESVDPDDLDVSSALAFWLNLYNAGALRLAGEAFATGKNSVLRLPGGFTKPQVSVGGERLSLQHIEHGKIRRFRDPRIHSALVCGSASCPTLRYEPYRGDALDGQLDDQTRSFLAAGGAVIDNGALALSRVFLWYGSDFVRPHRMPTFVPAPRRKVAQALSPWLPEEQQRWFEAGRRKVGFQAYDWGLACSVNRPA